MKKSKDWRHRMEYQIEVNVGAQVYGQLTKKGIQVAKDAGEPVAEQAVETADEASVGKETEPILFSLQIATNQKTLAPEYVTIYSPLTGKPVSMSCVEFELLMRMYHRGRARLEALAGGKKAKAKLMEPSPVVPAEGPAADIGATGTGSGASA